MNEEIPKPARAIEQSKFPESISDGDITVIEAFQRSNLRTGDLDADAEGGRFLSTRTEADVLHRINDEGGIVALKDSEELMGYFLASSYALATTVDSQRVFLEQAKVFRPDIAHDLILHQCFVAPDYRGSKVPATLLREIKRRFGARYAYGVGKIGADNNA